MRDRRRRLTAAIAAGLLAAAAIVAAVALQNTSGHKPSAAALRYDHENFHKDTAVTDKPRRGEDNPSSPSEEQVADRAYPRNYVSDEVAAAERKAFQSLPRSTSPSSFGSANAYNAAKAATPVQWNALGPVTPNVSRYWTQFINPVTGAGNPTQESGRVTALAIDPNCAPGACRMWVAAAGGGIWRTDDALAGSVKWIAPSAQLPTNSFGSLYYDATNHTLYAGSGEPNGSSDSEAGLGLFKSTDFGATWTLVPGSFPVAVNRSVGSIAIDDGTNPATVYIGTDVARHGSSSVNGGRRTPPNAPALGVYKSVDGGRTFSLESELSTETPPSPNPPSGGSDWFQGGINKLELDPNNHNMLYAAVFGYGIWRTDESTAAPRTWTQVFHTMNQNNFSDPNNPIGDSTGDRTEFDLVNRSGTTGIYVGDASDDFVTNPGSGPLPQAWRNYQIASVTGDPNGNYTNPLSDGWVQLSNSSRTYNGFGVYGFCQNGQCGYDEFVSSPPGQPNTVWYGGSMNYSELYADDQNGLGAPPISDGRAVVRSTNANAGNPSTASTVSVTWQDMTAVLADPSVAWDVQQGIHPDLHAVVFAQNGNTAFIGSDGGVVRIDVSHPQNQSSACAQRTWAYGGPGTPAQPLAPADLGQCQMLLNGVPDSITPLNNGLVDLQYQSVSANPSNPNDMLGGTQDNGTWSLNGDPVGTEVVGGDGGQSGFNSRTPAIRWHSFFDATPDVNFHGGDPTQWLDTYDVLQASQEQQSFYTPFTTDPVTPGRAFIGLQHVWRTDDNGGSEASLAPCNELHYTAQNPCGDWRTIGPDLTGNLYGTSRNGQFVVATVRAPSDVGTLWAATRTGRVFVSRNSNVTPARVGFHRIDTPATPGRFVSGIAVDPTNPNHAWISFSGYNAYTPTTPGHVFEVTYKPRKYTATWIDRSYNMGDQPVTGIAENEQTGDLYAATDFGVLRLAAGSKTWINAAPGLPSVAVYGLTYSQSAHLLFAATHGRGVFSLKLPVRPTGTLRGF